jgi:hypothetical protein
MCVDLIRYKDLADLPAKSPRMPGGKIKDGVNPVDYKTLCSPSFDPNAVTLPLLKQILKAQADMPDVNDLSKAQLVRVYDHVFGRAELVF